MTKLFKSVISVILSCVIAWSVHVVTPNRVLAEDGVCDFIRSSSSRESVYSIVLNDHSISVVCTEKYGSTGNLYIDDQYADSDVKCYFCSDGQTVYYSKDSAVYRMDVNTLRKELILSDDAYIEGVYNNKYLYYVSSKYMDVTDSLQDLIIYDLIRQEEVTYIADVGEFEIGGSKIFVEPCTGAIVQLEIREFDLDGSNEKIIANDETTMKVIDNILYYGAIEYAGYSDSSVRSMVKAYDINTGKIEELTDFYDQSIVIKLTPTYAVFKDLVTGEEFTVRYKYPRIVLNGDELLFDQPPINTPEGRILVPIRKIAESMGKRVLWSQETRTAFIDNGDSGLIIPLYEKQMYIANENGFSKWDKVFLDVPALEMNGRTLVPLRAFCESLGASVKWVDEEQTAYITYNASNKEQMNDMLFDSICMAYYIEKVSSNPFTEYSDSIDDFYNNRTEWADAVAMGLSDPFAGINDLASGSPNAVNVMKMSLEKVISEIPDSKISDYDTKLLEMLKDTVASGLDIYSDVGGLGSKIREYSETYEYLDDALLNYSKKYNSTASGIFDLSLFTLKELSYILTDYENNMEYINAFEDALRDCGRLDDNTKSAIDLLRTEYSDKFIGVVLDLRKECLEEGAIASLGLVLGGTGAGLGKLAWDVVFSATGINRQGENLKVFYGVFCVDGALNKALSYKLEYDKPTTSAELSQFKCLWKMTKAEKITAYKAMKSITNWYNEDSKKYADDCVRELSSFSYRLFK